MRFAFSTVACPTWDFATIARNAKRYGYDGVELCGFGDADQASVNNPYLTDAAKVRALFGAEGVEIACLATRVAMAGNKREDAERGDEARRHIELAASLGCGVVKVLDTAVRAGRSRAVAMAGLEEFLAPLGDFAGAHGVLLVVENALSFRTAREMWLLLDRLRHPRIAACWDVLSAAQAGEAPATSVPTLNSRIAYAQVRDATFSPAGVTYVNLGEGAVKVQNFLTRLMGIGYRGYVTFEWARAAVPGLAPAEEALPQAMGKMKEWTTPKGRKTAGKAAGGKVAAAAAPGAAPVGGR